MDRETDGETMETRMEKQKRGVFFRETDGETDGEKRMEKRMEKQTEKQMQKREDF